MSEPHPVLSRTQKLGLHPDLGLGFLVSSGIIRAESKIPRNGCPIECSQDLCFPTLLSSLPRELLKVLFSFINKSESNICKNSHQKERKKKEKEKKNLFDKEFVNKSPAYTERTRAKWKSWSVFYTVYTQTSYQLKF